MNTGINLNGRNQLYGKSRRPLLPILSGLIVSSLVFSAVGYAALSTTTAKTIRAFKPVLTFDSGITVAKDLDALVSLTMPDPLGGEKPIDITPSAYPTGTPINAKPGVKFSDFTTKVTADSTALTLSPTYYYDIDGDTPDTISPVGGSLKATWTYQLDNTTKTVSNAELNNPLTACNAPYTLKIEAENVSAKSLYGDPNINNYGSITQTYQVNINDYKFCYAKPADLTIQRCRAGICAYPNGYNPVVFVPNLGFIPKNNRASSMEPNFPTSGFYGAKFQLIMSNGQSSYNYSVTKGDNLASVDTSGIVTFDKVAKGTPLINDTIVEITATPTVSGFSEVTYEFEIKKSKWARILRQPLQTGTEYNTALNFTDYYPTAELCGAPKMGQPGRLRGRHQHAIAGAYSFNRTDFTSSPGAYKDYYDIQLGYWLPNMSTTEPYVDRYTYSSRDINGKFIDEWGNLYKNNPYPESGFGIHWLIWTGEASASGTQYIIDSQYGSVSKGLPHYAFLAVCR